MMGSQCVRSDGRGWRCVRQALVGSKMCEHHYLQKLKYLRSDKRRQRRSANTSSYFEDGNKKSSLVAKEIKGMIIGDTRPENCCAISSDDVSEKDCVKEKEIAVEKTVDICLDYHDAVSKDGEKDEGNRTAKMCVSSDERGRRCRQQVRVGNDSCVSHLRLKNMIMANKRKDKNVSDHVYDQKRSLKGEGNEDEKQVNGYSMCDDHIGSGSKSSFHKKLVNINHFTDVVEKDRADTEVNCADERISKASQCTRTDGKRWRCRQQAIVGYNMCEHHLRLKGIRMVKVNFLMDVVEKDLASSKVSSEAERITQDSQCTHMDGKQWRCRQQALVGYNLCEHHLVQDQNSRSKNVDATSDSEDENEKAQLVAVKRKQSEIADIIEDSRCRCADGNGWRCREQALVGYNTCERHLRLKGIRMVKVKFLKDVIEKDLANSKVSSEAERITQDSQCTHMDGKRWRCRQQVLVGYNLCEHHLDQDQNSRSKNVDATSDSDDENEKGQPVVVKRKGIGISDITEDSRCRCTDGMGWRCSQQARAGYNFCEHHFGKRRLC